MQKLQTVNAETLLYEPLEKPSFVVDSLIPTGLSLFCGSQKIGKTLPSARVVSSVRVTRILLSMCTAM